MPEVVRCAVYTRKSTEDGLEQDFNSLDAQFEACAAYVASQKAEGWLLSPTRYDDGGVSGGTMERPGLNQLLADIEAGKIDQIVVYKIDRLTRSLSDFAKIVDRLDAANASFVSVTQSFNTATSMGRLTLNMLLSFAQFEREVTAERIRDKIAASKKRGLWMGGNRPLGYQPEGRSLLIDEDEAKIIRLIYKLYEEFGSVRAVTEQLAALGHKTRVRSFSDGSTKGGKQFSRGHVYQILSNPIYAGRIRHKKQSFKGQHDAIIDPKRWDGIQAKLVKNAARERDKANAANKAPLAGKLFDAMGDRLTPSHASKNGKRHRYYVSRRLVTGLRDGQEDGWRLPATTVEAGLGDIIAKHIRKSGFVLDIIENLTATEVTTIENALQSLASDCTKPDAHSWSQFLRRAEFADDRVKIRLCKKALAKTLDIPTDRIVSDATSFEASFEIKKRGVETKIILGAAKPNIDQTLIKNIATAHRWYAALKAGDTLADIASKHKTDLNRIAQMMPLAFLAPDIVEDIVHGKQPINFTSQWVKRNKIPHDWDAQRQIISAL